MLKESMTETTPAYMYLRRHSRHLMIILAALLVCTVADAEIFKPIQVILPGNFRGAATELLPSLKTNPALCWRIPETIKGLQRNQSNDTVVFATGNDSSIFAPLSFLSYGAIERDLINAANPEAAGLSPDDLEIFAGKPLNAEIKERIWTNLESETGKLIFNSHGKKTLGSKNLWLFNFIGADFCKNLAIGTMGQLTIDEPARSLRRLAFAVGSKDYTISFAYLAQNDLQSLIAQLKKTPGYHFLIQIPTGNEKPIYSVYYGEQDENIFKMSLMPGHSFLPVLNIFSKNNGAPRMTLRMLPLSKSQDTGSESLFQRAKARIKDELHQTLRLIKTTYQASTSSFTFKPQLHARLIQNRTACDLAFLIAPPMKHLNDNAVSTGHILSSFNNDRIRQVKLNGSEIRSLFEKLISARGTEDFVFSGCDVNYIGGRITSFKLGNQELAAEKTYLCATSEGSLQDIICASYMANQTFAAPDGQTIWRIWQNGLKSLRISEDLLLND